MPSIAYSAHSASMCPSVPYLVKTAISNAWKKSENIATMRSTAQIPSMSLRSFLEWAMPFIISFWTAILVTTCLIVNVWM